MKSLLDVGFSPQNNTGDMREEQGADLGWEKRQEALAGNSFMSETSKHFLMSAQDTSLLTVYEIVTIDRSTRGYASSYANM